MHPRTILKNLLGFLTQLTLKKHNPDIIVITGEGQTSIVREALYTVLFEKLNVRRNIEFPEAELGVPLTVFGQTYYPKTVFEWIEVIFKVLSQLIYLKSYKHTLILEISSMEANTNKWWIEKLNPQFVISVPSNIDLTSKETLPHSIFRLINDILNFYKFEESYYFEQIKKLTLPNSKIKIKSSKQGAVIIDSRHYYYPSSIEAVLEVASSFEGKKVLITNIESDISYVKDQKGWNINPHSYIPSKGEVVLLRGDKTKINERWMVGYYPSHK